MLLFSFVSLWLFFGSSVTFIETPGWRYSLVNVCFCWSPLGNADCSILCNSGLGVRSSCLLVDFLCDDFRHSDSLYMEVAERSVARPRAAEVGHE